MTEKELWYSRVGVVFVNLNIHDGDVLILVNDRV